MIDPLAIRTQTSGEQEREFPASEVERATGSKTLSGNQLELQYEGSSTFSLWLDGISRARSMVYLENYLIRDDRVGRAFRDVHKRQGMCSSKKPAVVFQFTLSMTGSVAGRHPGHIGSLSERRVCMSERSIRLHLGLEIRLGS